MSSSYDQIYNKIFLKANKLGYQESMQHAIPNLWIGDPNYNQKMCLASVIKKLRENNFEVKYVKPNLLIVTNIVKEKIIKGKEISDSEILRILEKYT